MNYNKSSSSLEEMEKSTFTMEDAIILGKKVNKSLNKHYYIDKTSNHLHKEFNTK